MTDRGDTGRSTATARPVHDPARIRPRNLGAGDILPIAPNLLAAVVGFCSLIAAPWVCWHALGTFLDDAIGEDRVAGLFIVASFEEPLIVATVGAILFLVIGAILQFWQYQHPFPSALPVYLAFPIIWSLLVPEALLHGGTILTCAIVGSVFAASFGAQWATLVYLRETMD